MTYCHVGRKVKLKTTESLLGYDMLEIINGGDEYQFRVCTLF